MKRERKIYDPAFKTKAVQLSKERTNVSELAIGIFSKNGR